MGNPKTTRQRLKSPFWRPNPNPDFEPYKCGAGWCVSIQYLGVWKYKTEEDAVEDIPALKNYRRSVLRQIEIANAKYFNKLEQEERKRKRELKDYRTTHPKRYGTNHLTIGQRNRLISMIQDGADEEQCKEMFNISTHTYATLKHHYGERYD